MPKADSGASSVNERDFVQRYEIFRALLKQSKETMANTGIIVIVVCDEGSFSNGIVHGEGNILKAIVRDVI